MSANPGAPISTGGYKRRLRDNNKNAKAALRNKSQGRDLPCRRRCRFQCRSQKRSLWQILSGVTKGQVFHFIIRSWYWWVWWEVCFLHVRDVWIFVWSFSVKACDLLCNNYVCMISVNSGFTWGPVSGCGCWYKLWALLMVVWDLSPVADILKFLLKVRFKFLSWHKWFMWHLWKILI